MDSTATLPGCLIASTAAPCDDYAGPDGDGPPTTDSSDAEEDDTFPEHAVWSKTGGGREGSFRRTTEEKRQRAQKIRSDVLTSHLVTPVVPKRSIDPSFKRPAVAATVEMLPRRLDSINLGATANQSVGMDAKLVARNSGASRKANLDRLSSLAARR